MMSTGIFFSIANIILPMLALVIIPNPSMNFEIIEDYVGECDINLRLCEIVKY